MALNRHTRTFFRTEKNIACTKEQALTAGGRSAQMPHAHTRQQPLGGDTVLSAVGLLPLAWLQETEIDHIFR